MVICVHSLIQKMKWLWIYFTSSLHLYQKKIKIRRRPTKIIRLKKLHQISICFTSKQYGALIVMLLMLEMHASMLITGRISEENLMSLSTKESSARNGKPKILFRRMQMVVAMNTDVNFLMAGRNKSIILTTIRCTLADRVNLALNHTVLTFTPTKIRGCLSTHFSNFSPETEVVRQVALTMPFTSSINQFSWIFFSNRLSPLLSKCNLYTDAALNQFQFLTQR